MTNSNLSDITIFAKTNYEFFEKNRYSISYFYLNNEEYSSICNNGFIKLHSNKCKSYWLCQNENEHTTQDWKFHVSINPIHVKQAWDLISKIFIENKCRTGMKVIYLNENENIKKGREITIYILKYDNLYDNSLIRKDFNFDFCDEHSEDFWLEIFNKIEKELKENFILSNNLAIGDLKLGNYISLRNEGYIKVKGEYQYPPDNYGWNAARHKLPFDIEIFRKKKNITNKLIQFSFVIILFVILYEKLKILK